MQCSPLNVFLKHEPNNSNHILKNLTPSLYFPYSSEVVWQVWAAVLVIWGKHFPAGLRERERAIKPGSVSLVKCDCSCLPNYILCSSTVFSPVMSEPQVHNWITGYTKQGRPHTYAVTPDFFLSFRSSTSPPRRNKLQG